MQHIKMITIIDKKDGHINNRYLYQSLMSQLEIFEF
jgi:hypothetical protein